MILSNQKSMILNNQQVAECIWLITFVFKELSLDIIVSITYAYIHMSI